MAYRVLKAGLKVVEVPIEFVERQLGASKMSRRIVMEAMEQVTIWGIKSLFGVRR
jgi:dolichol-phosphate mannosyltransferase